MFRTSIFWSHLDRPLIEFVNLLGFPYKLLLIPSIFFLFFQKICEKPQIVNDYEAGRGIPNNVILGKIERVIGLKLRGKERGAVLEPPGQKKWMHRRLDDSNLLSNLHFVLKIKLFL